MNTEPKKPKLLLAVALALALTACGDRPAPQGFVITPSGGASGVTAATSGGGLTVSSGTVGITVPSQNGLVPMYNGSTWSATTSCGDPTQRWCLYEEFLSGGTSCTTGIGGAWTGVASGSPTCPGTQVAGHPGIWTGITAATATSGVKEGTGIATITLGGNVGETCVTELAYLPAVSTAVVEYIVRLGLGDTATANGNNTDGVTATYDRPNTGDFWALETRSNGTSTVKACDGSGGTTSAPVQAATWVKLKQCVDSDGATARLYVNDVQCATNTTNIPTGTSRVVGLTMQIYNNSGSTPAAESLYVDYVLATGPFGPAR